MVSANFATNPKEAVLGAFTYFDQKQADNTYYVNEIDFEWARFTQTDPMNSMYLTYQVRSCVKVSVFMQLL